MSSYNSLHAVKQEIRRMRRNGPESTSYGMWNSILNFQFPVSQGHITRPQDEHTSQSGEKGYSDLHVFHYRGRSRRADKSLILHCKRAGLETRSSVWKEGIEQLERYLAASHGTRRVSNRSPVYGIVAVGKYMRVYRYDDISRSVYDWSPPGVKDGELLHLVRHHAKIQEVLRGLESHSESSLSIKVVSNSCII